jgi:hypothetical protein
MDDKLMADIEPIDGLSKEELKNIEKRLGDQVEAYSTVITRIAPDDKRDPPGDLHGTGSYMEVDTQIYLLTCEHVARNAQHEMLCASFHGSEAAFNLPNPFSSLTYPVDAAITAITEATWKIDSHQAKVIPYRLFAETHSPVAGELMYVSGFPGESSHIWPSIPAECDQDLDEPGIQFYTTNVIMCEIQGYFDSVMNEETPRPLEGMHFLLPYTPQHATNMNEKHGIALPRAPGLSGSLVWNTRYWEVTREGHIWQPEDARVTGIVWGNSTKAGVLVATPIQYVRQFVEHARISLAEGKPYWSGPVES